MSLFTPGQRVICIRTKPWYDYQYTEVLGPDFGSEWVVAEVLEGKFSSFFPERADKYYIALVGWQHIEHRFFGESNFKPLDPIGKLKSLLTSKPKEIEKV